jgi:hypothetical protein
MKRATITSLTGLCLLMLAGCSEEFSPKGGFDDKAFLYSVINVTDLGTTSVEAVLLHSYDVAGFDPMTNHTDPVIRGAQVSVWVNNLEYQMTERRTGRLDTTRYHGPQWYYGTSTIMVLPGSSVRMTARLLDGRVLTAETQAPVHKPIETTPAFGQRGFNTNRNLGREFVIDWGAVREAEHLFLPSLSILYKLTDDTLGRIRSAPVPTLIIERGGTQVPLYPQLSSATSCTFNFDAIDAAMAGISAGDSQKNRYKIIQFTFSLHEYDFPFSRYYSSVNGSLDQYSVRLDESVYSNIQGGIGVLGSTYQSTMSYEVQPRFAEQFGYQGP